MATYNVNEVLKQIFSPEDVGWKPIDKIPLVIKEIELCKNELKTFLASSDYDVEGIIKESEELCSESNLLVDDLESCKKEIEQETMADIVKSIENFETLSKELQCVNFASSLIANVLQCGHYLVKYEEGRDAQSFTKSVEGICDLMQFLEAPFEGAEYLDFACKSKEAAPMFLRELVQEMYTEWSRLVNWDIKPANNETTIFLTIKLDESLICHDMLKALEICKKLPEKISELAEFLFNDILKPMLYNESIVFVDTPDVLTVTISHKTNNKPFYNDVISNYKCLFHFLSTKLNLDFKDNSKVTLMTMLGEELSSSFADIVIKDCFIDTIPNNITDLQTYGQITSEIEDFQRFLVNIKFFPDERISILKYIENIDILFADKASRHLLESARVIMLKDLSVSMSIGVESIPNETGGSNEAQEALVILDKTLPTSLFYFPRCMISKSAQELLDLVYVIMEQAVQCPEVVCKKLYNTTRLIFELYDAVVPYHHENYLQTIPQYVALFHNNCMYLAHNMQTLGDKWLTHMEEAPSYPISFVDLVQKLRELGYKHLTVHMQQQRKQILDSIRSSDLNCIVVKDVLSDNAEAAIRQCLRQLHILKNVWIGVFPSNIFIRLMATLVNMLIEELIHRVCTVEDISMEMASQLTDMYALVVQKAPQLFQQAHTAGKQDRPWDTEDMKIHVKSWMKLQELIYVLGGSLKDIENHWKDGNGPLAVHFRTEELRSLIKALFQNTQIRANLLSKIK